MTRTKLADRDLPDYTRREEVVNSGTHIFGGIIGVLATVLCIITAAKHNNLYGIISGAIFGASMITLYSVSSIYHGLKPSYTKKIFQVIDHCTIFLLIAGTYTPFTLCILRESSESLGWIIFGIVWGLAVIGIILNAIDLNKFKVISMILYLGMGWCIIVTVKQLYKALGATGFYLLLFGGIAYTIGAIFYMFGKKKRYIHSVFHVFVDIGSILHFLCVLFYVM